MPLSSSSTASSLGPNSNKRRGRKSLRAAATAAVSVLLLLASPSSTHAASVGGLRGSPRPPQHELPEYNKSLPKEDEIAMQEDRTLAKRKNNDYGEKVVRIDPFTTNLLEVHFPLGIHDENLLSGVVSSYIARYLSGVLDEPLVDLGIDCTKYQQQIGPEMRWVLEIQGVATFDEAPKEDVIAIITRAFAGTDKELFLAEMYPRYEWNYESHRLSRGRRQQKPGKKKKRKKNKNKKNKNKKNNKKKTEKNIYGGGQDGDSNVNVMGYISGSQGQAMSTMSGGGKDQGYEIINGNVHVYINDKGGGGGNNAGSKGKPSPKQNDKPGKMHMQQGQVNKSQYKQKNEPNENPQQSEGQLNVMGFVSGSQGREEGSGIKNNGIIHVQVRDGRKGGG